jgi:16S rRNA (guanine(966)-N(2))-methyltransferase RsmD
MAKRRRSTRKQNSRPGRRGGRVEALGLRIVGGRLRGRKLSYGGDMHVRPMKDRTREAVFNLLGPAIRGVRVFDLFAGTGAMALEAISRGAVGAVMIERHLPTARVIRENIKTVGAEAECEVVVADVFRWATQAPKLDARPWVVFCCPPYDFFVHREAETLELIGTMLDAAPSRSAVVVESDDRFDKGLLPEPDEWDTRRYFPAVVGIRWKP